jgi:uncharacterized cupin superfamily protein
MKPYDLVKILKSSPNHEVSGARSGHFWDMASFHGGSSWIGKWVGKSPWERHAKGDEFIHVLKGTVEVVIITSSGKKSVLVPEGNVFVVPKDHWHQQRALAEVVILGATPGVTDHSDSEPSWG